MFLQENIIFDNHYTLIRILGIGGFSEVWLAHDSYMDLDVVLKIYAPGRGMDQSSIDEFRHEIKEVFNLNHSNLLKPQYLGVYEKMPYLVLSYCRAGSITKQIGKLSEEQIWKLIHDVASGLAYLHKNDIVHQDIKPDNILLDDNGNYVITDFGISTKARSTLRKSIITGGAMSGGTRAYMGPERFGKQPTPTKASDIWSFGVMAYELVTGNVPFGEMGGVLQKAGAEIPEINEPISDKLRQTIESMLALDTWNRPTAESVLELSINRNKSAMAGNNSGNEHVYNSKHFSISEDIIIFPYKASQRVVYVNTQKSFSVEKKSESDWLQIKCFPDNSVIISVRKNAHNSELRTEINFYEEDKKNDKRTLTIIQRPFIWYRVWWIWFCIVVVVIITIYFAII